MTEEEVVPGGPEEEDESEAGRIVVERDEEPLKGAPRESITGGTGKEGLFKTRLPLSRIEKGALIFLMGAP
ncbi:MAG: hypothetical protein KAJ35_09225, partial [Thermoplasmata archaeon]|nr:hypothetical protein [Thermoplasmata archaeon]